MINSKVQISVEDYYRVYRGKSWRSHGDSNPGIHRERVLRPLLQGFVTFRYFTQPLKTSCEYSYFNFHLDSTRFIYFRISRPLRDLKSNHRNSISSWNGEGLSGARGPQTSLNHLGCNTEVAPNPLCDQEKSIRGLQWQQSP